MNAPRPAPFLLICTSRTAGLLLSLSGLLALTPPLAPAATVKAWRSQLDIPTYPWTPPVRHPYFRDTDKVNIYPYPMLDFLSREKTNRTYRTVVLENEYLRVTFLPELGGKIHEVTDKTTGRPMFYVNHVIKPGLIGQCGAWTSGGVEWNTGPQGHTVGCMQPVAVEILPPEKDGSRSVAIGETERIYRTKWTVIVTLRPGRSFLEERIRIYNPTETIRPYYFWNCTAMPNTPGFRFIYPMTLGTDHGAEKFFNWPIHEGKDLSRGTNYQDASSIFAWHCDQDFFGSYDDGADCGVVSYANHHQVPGKKAWTWGQGGFGKMHQMDLTDTDGPYNEVQTGPLLTQGEVGRLDPCEAVEWQEWWYPVHGIGGFTFANKDVAVQAERNGANLTLKLMGSGAWKDVSVSLRAPGGSRTQRDATCDISPRKAAIIQLGLSEGLARNDRLWVELRKGPTQLALFPLPLDLPKREAPAKKAGPKTATELAQAGWEDFLFARRTEAESHFRKALEADPKSTPARIGLAFLSLDSDPKTALQEATSALDAAPDSGLAHYARGVAADRAGDRVTALDEAWKAALDPDTAIAARALVAKLNIRVANYQGAAAALMETGPWQNDPLCRNRLAFACLQLGDRSRAIRLARENLEVDPLDSFALSILWMANAEAGTPTLRQLMDNDLAALMELIANHADIAGDNWASINRLLAQFYLKTGLPRDPIADYWTAAGMRWSGDDAGLADLNRSTSQLAAAGVFPYQLETVRILRDALECNPQDGKASLYLGHLLFHLGRHADGRAMWQKGAELGAEPVIAGRALGMAAKTLDNDLKTAREWLKKANESNPADSIVARDLARVLFELGDKAGSDADKRELVVQARDRLQAAFPEGKGRSDFVTLLGRAQNRLGQYAETARMLDSVRVTVWEGAREIHDLFEDAHLALGRAHLEAGRPAEALAEFNRALEYPENLATGKLEKTREAHIHYLRGNALSALGQKPEAIAAWKQAATEPESRDAAKEEARKKAQEALDRASR